MGSCGACGRVPGDHPSDRVARARVADPDRVRCGRGTHRRHVGVHLAARRHVRPARAAQRLGGTGVLDRVERVGPVGGSCTCRARSCWAPRSCGCSGSITRPRTSGRGATRTFGSAPDGRSAGGSSRSRTCSCRASRCSSSTAGRRPTASPAARVRRSACGGPRGSRPRSCRRSGSSPPARDRSAISSRGSTSTRPSWTSRQVANAVAPWLLVAGIVQVVAGALAIAVIRRVESGQHGDARGARRRGCCPFPRGPTRSPETVRPCHVAPAGGEPSRRV